MSKAYQPVVLSILRAAKAAEILDAPSGRGWLSAALPSARIDGVDLYADAASASYRSFTAHDLDNGLPIDLPAYDAIACCEGIEHFANPGLFFISALDHLRPGGTLIVSTPNIWYPQARLRFLTRGYFPSFPALAGRIKRGSHMHIMPWNWPQLYTHLVLAGFIEVTLHPCLEPERVRLFDRLAASAIRRSYARKADRSSSDEEERFWTQCATDAAVLARRLVVSARRPRAASAALVRSPDAAVS